MPRTIPVDVVRCHHPARTIPGTKNTNVAKGKKEKKKKAGNCAELRRSSRPRDREGFTRRPKSSTKLTKLPLPKRAMKVKKFRGESRAKKEHSSRKREMILEKEDPGNELHPRRCRVSAIGSWTEVGVRQTLVPGGERKEGVVVVIRQKGWRIWEELPGDCCSVESDSR